MAAITIALIIFVSSAEAKEPRPTTQTLFIHQPNRDQQTLEKDAELIFERIRAAMNGDSVHLVTTNVNETIFTIDLPEKLNRFEKNKLEGKARKALKTYFMGLLKNPPSPDLTVDIAGAITTAMKRFNAKPHDEMRLVILSDGLQTETTFSWRGGFPGDSWTANPSSPFADIEPNSQNVPLKVLMLATKTSFVDAYHASTIERWYRLLFQTRKAHLVQFTFDHATVATLLRNGVEVKDSQPIEVDERALLGPLSFTTVKPLNSD